MQPVISACLYVLFPGSLLINWPAARQQAELGTVTIRAALVGDNLEVKAVPLHQLSLVPISGQGEPIPIRTGLDGLVSQQAPAGEYSVESDAPVTLNGKRYAWRTGLKVVAGRAVMLELSNANAVIDSVATSTTVQAVPTTAAPAPTGRQMAPEVEVYQRIRRGVFRIQSGLARGSGFLVDATEGLVLTNAHVVDGVSSVSVIIDSATHVRAQILHRANEADVAVLRVAPSRTASLPALTLATSHSDAALVESGERLFAVGYPLNQEQTLTSGIASSVRDGAIISDVNINHGNSGGPLLNLAGEVVAINTFGDFPQNGGPGISGSIVIARALPILTAARDSARNSPGPPDSLLAMLPTARYPLASLKAFADTLEVKKYKDFSEMGTSRFYVALATPVISYVRDRTFEEDIGKDRKKRESKGHVQEDERFSLMRDKRDWEEYVGDSRTPVVSITVVPKVGETGGSVFRRLMLTGPGGKATYRFSGDLRDVVLYRDAVHVPPIVGGRQPVKQYVDNHWVNLKDVADAGFFVYPAETLAPHPDGTPPSIVIEVHDLKHPDEIVCKEVPMRLVGTAWNDFEPFFREHGKATDFIRAEWKDRVRTPEAAAFFQGCNKGSSAPDQMPMGSPKP